MMPRPMPPQPPTNPDFVSYEEAKQIMLRSGMTIDEVSRQLYIMSVFNSTVKVGDRYIRLKP